MLPTIVRHNGIWYFEATPLIKRIVKLIPLSAPITPIFRRIGTLTFIEIIRRKED